MAAIIPAAVIGAAVGSQLPDFFRDAVDQLGQGEGYYLRDGEPQGIVAQIGQAVGRGYCRAYDSVSDEYEPGKAARIERACRPYLDSLDSPGGPGLVLPARGGQCPVEYVIDFEFRNRTSNQFNCEAFGPWTAVTGSTGIPTGAIIGPVSGPNEVVTTVTTPSGFNRRQQFVVEAANRTLSINLQGAASRVYWAGCGPSYEIRNVVFRRVDGLADVCGSQEPVPRVPTPTPRTPLPPFRFNPSPDIDIDIDVQVNNDASVTFNIGTGPITVDPFAGDDDGGGEPPDPTPGPETEPGEPGDPVPTGPGGDAEGEAEDGEELVGLLVTVVGTPENPNVFDNNVATVYRGIGYVRMGYPGRLGVDISGGTVISPQFFHAPQRGLTSWAVSANLGFSLVTTPYYRSVT